MSKKTAMKELLEWVEYRKSVSVNSHLGAWNMIITKIKDEQLVIEKQQIKDAYNQGYRDGERDAESQVSEKDIADFDDAENYYTETYQS